MVKIPYTCKRKGTRDDKTEEEALSFWFSSSAHQGTGVPPGTSPPGFGCRQHQPKPLSAVMEMCCVHNAQMEATRHMQLLST